MSDIRYEDKVSSRDFLASDFADKLKHRLREGQPRLTTPEMSERIAATLNFLNLVASNPDREFAPTPVVDDVWHEMVTHTADYRLLCRRLGGFIDHTPFHEFDPANPTPDETIDAFAAAGVVPVGAGVIWERGAQARCCGGHISLD